MTTEEIADALELTAKLMELHEENPFKVKAVAGGAYRLSKTRIELAGKTQEEAGKLTGDKSQQAKGLGKQVAGKAEKAYGDMKEGVKNADRDRH